MTSVHSINTPVFPESVTEGTVALWHKKPGEAVLRDEVLVEIETDKIVLEVAAPKDGCISSIVKNEGETVLSQEVLAHFEEGVVDQQKAIADADADDESTKTQENKNSGKSKLATEPNNQTVRSGPAARRLMEEQGIAPEKVAQGSDRISKKDVLERLDREPVTGLETESVRIEKRVPMSRMRASIASRLVQAQQEAAMLTTF